MSSSSQTLAPVAVFAFKRPEHTQRALEALASNPEFLDSPLFIYCDGARNEKEAAAVDAVRALVKAFPHPNKTVVDAPKNQGLAASITQGVSALCSRYGQVIVVEDDLLVSSRFLDYMNRALDHYRDDARVMQISGHMFPVELDRFGAAIFLPFTTSWGWATWARAWPAKLHQPEEAIELMKRYSWRRRFDIDGVYPYTRMLTDQMLGKNNSWAIWWYFHVFKQNGFALYPTRTLVRNEGFDGSGTHCGTRHNDDGPLLQEEILQFPAIEQNMEASDCVRRYLIASRGLPRRFKDNWKRVFPTIPRAA